MGKILWAVEHGCIAEDKNPCERIIPKKTFYRLTQERERPDDRIVIPPDQILALNRQIREDYEKQPGYMPVYAREFASLTGMRAGEIVTLKWSDIQGSFIQVRRRESENKSTGEMRIKTVSKNKKPRSVPLTDAVKDLLIRVREVEDKTDGWMSISSTEAAAGLLFISCCPV